MSSPFRRALPPGPPDRSGAASRPGTTRTIGEVLAELQPTFPELTISKIRFYEAQGLVEPERTPSGYRKFNPDDVNRLRYILTAARDHYLPLRVIKEHLDALDRGLTPGTRGGEPQVPDPPAPSADGVTSATGTSGADALARPETFAPPQSELRLSFHELRRASGLDDAALHELEQYGLIAPRQGSSYYDGDALVIAKIVAAMRRFGLEARHLRPVKAAADREIGLVEQVVSPLARQRNPEARVRAEEAVRELAALSVRLHATLVKVGLRTLVHG